MNRKFSIPVLDEPFSREFTQQIYDEKETDYGGGNNGKPFDSFIVHSGRAGGSSGYIRTIEKAEEEVYKRLKNSLETEISDYRNRLKRLNSAKKQLNNRGIKAFEID